MASPCASVIITVRAGHATTLPRQRGHVFRPNNCCLLQYVFILCGYTPFRHKGLNIFSFFSCHRSSITLSRCHCREANQLSRAQVRLLPSRRVLVVLPGLVEAGPQPEHGQHDSRMGSAMEKYCLTMSSMYNQRLLYICHYYLFFELFTSPPL